MAIITFDTTGLGLFSYIRFDAVMSEVHNDSSIVTEHPIEKGANISDHVMPEQPKLNIEAFITNTPIESEVLLYGTTVGALFGLSLPISLQGAMNRWVNGAQVRGGDLFPLQTNGFQRPQTPIVTTPSQRVQIPNVVAGTSLQFPKRVDRVRKVYAALQEVMQKGVPVAYFGSLRDYPRMFISRLSAPLVAEDSITFSMELVSVSFADSRTVEVTKKRPEEKRAAETAVQGPQAPASIDFGDDEQTTSTNAREILQSIAS